MAQANDKHLTTEQLSAYIDKELSSQERTTCDTHLQTCQRCQGRAADLRLTSGLLRALPQEEAPRSFALPATIAFLPDSSAQPEVINRRPTRARRVLRNTFRAVSTIAAVIGFLFILTGLLTGLASFHGGGAATSNTSQPSSGTYAQATRGQPTAVSSTGGVPHIQGTSPTAGPKPTPSSPAGKLVPTSPSPSQPQPPPVPAVLNISTPVGLLGVGFILLVLGILGGFSIRRWWRIERRIS